MRLRWNRRFAFFLTVTHAAWHELQLSIDGEAQSLGWLPGEDIAPLARAYVSALRDRGAGLTGAGCDDEACFAEVITRAAREAPLRATGAGARSAVGRVRWSAESSALRDQSACDVFARRITCDHGTWCGRDATDVYTASAEVVDSVIAQRRRLQATIAAHSLKIRDVASVAGGLSALNLLLALPPASLAPLDSLTFADVACGQLDYAQLILELIALCYRPTDAALFDVADGARCFVERWFSRPLAAFEARINARLDVTSQAAWFAEHPFDAARANATRVALPEKLATLYEAIVEPLARAGIAGLAPGRGRGRLASRVLPCFPRSRAGGGAYATNAKRGAWRFPDDSRPLEPGVALDKKGAAWPVSSSFEAPNTNAWWYGAEGSWLANNDAFSHVAEHIISARSVSMVFWDANRDNLDGALPVGRSDAFVYLSNVPLFLPPDEFGSLQTRWASEQLERALPVPTAVLGGADVARAPPALVVGFANMEDGSVFALPPRWNGHLWALAAVRRLWPPAPANGLVVEVLPRRADHSNWFVGFHEIARVVVSLDQFMRFGRCAASVVILHELLADGGVGSLGELAEILTVARARARHVLVLEMNGGSREHAAHNLRDALLTPERLDAGALGAAPERALLAPGYGGAPDRNIVARFRGAVSLESPDQVPSCYLSNDFSEDVHDLHVRIVRAEQRYGGYVEVERNKISAKDVRVRDGNVAATLEALNARSRMVGGDRMSNDRHGYGKHYAAALRKVVDTKRAPTVVEVGILRGSGLATWSELFPSGRVVGLDIDLSYVAENLSFLKGKGAFAARDVELYEFDAYAPDAAALEEVFKGDAIDVFIDDGPHTVTAIIRTLNAIYPYLSDECVCFIEDNDKVHHSIAAQFPDFQVEPLGQLTILHRKQ